MKKLVFVLLVLFLLGCTQPMVVVDEEGTTRINHAVTVQGSMDNNLSEGEISALLYMREEEKLARDVYVALYNTWKIRAFSNISGAEQTHTDAVKSLLDSYKIQDTSLTQEGKFTNQKLQELYTTLVQEGTKSELAALRVGAAVEEIDIIDLKEYTTQTENPYIKTVYANLEKGSRNHLRAFVKQIQMRGETYTPQYLTEEEYNSIITTPTEKGQ
jgi:hypothetical protein